jgi:hypothetical protein
MTRIGLTRPVTLAECNPRSGSRITIFDTRTRGDNWKPRLERVVVAEGRRGVPLNLSQPILFR